MEVNFTGGFIYTQICKRDGKTIQTLENLCGKPAEGKNHGAKREISLNQRDYKRLFTLCYQFNSLGFDPPASPLPDGGPNV